MAQINYEIDLRSPECRSRGRFLKPKTVLILFYLLAILLLLSFCLMLENYKTKLQVETELLQKELSAKTETAEPLFIMSAELETFKQRKAIAENLLSGYRFKAECLEAIIMAASPGLNLSYLAIDAEGQIELKGDSTSIQVAALYARKLQELPLISKAELTAADLNEVSSCFFSISACLKQPAGGEDLEQYKQ